MYKPLTKANQKEELNTGRRLKKELKPSQTVFHQMKFMPGAELNYREKQNVPYRQQSLGDFRRYSSKGKEGTGGSLLSGVNFLLSAAYPVQRSAAPTGGAKKIVDFNGKKVTIDNNLFDPLSKDPKGRTNIERMHQGLAPIGKDGKSVNLHHENQTDDGPVKELEATNHQKNFSKLHTNTGQQPSQINRPAFNTWRNDYWKNRENNLE